LASNLPLAGYHVLDLGRTRAVAQGTHFLALLGARVTRIDIEGSCLSDVHDVLWNRDKERLAAAHDPADRARQLVSHLSAVDIVMHDFLPSEARALGLDPDSLSAAYPALVHVAVGAWPAGHPHQDMPVDDALALGSAGLFDEQQPVARDGPLWLRFPFSSALAAYVAASGALARLYVRNRSGKGGPVSTSLVQAGLLPMMMHWTRAENPTPSVQFGMPKDSGATLFECADGQWIHIMGAAEKSPAIAKALAEMPREVRDRHNEKYAGAVIPYLDGERGAVEAILMTRPSREWLTEFWASDVPAQPVQPMGALFKDEQALAAGYVVQRELPGVGKIRVAGAPFHLLTDTIGPDGAVPPVADVAQGAPKLPLEGVKVLDLGAFLAGPLVPMLLGDLGADVIKLEPLAGDPMRPGEWAFNGCQRSKRSISVQLKDPRGREVMERLVGWADIVHHNQRMPAADKLGFGWDRVRAINPSAIYSHVSSYGPAGPRKDWPGYDQLFQASAGWEQEGGGEGNPPMWHRFGVVDHLAALASLLVTLAALVRRDLTGKGEWVAASLLGASMAAWDSYMDEQDRLAPAPRLDSMQMGEGPAKRIARTSDGWIVMSSDDPEAPHRLARLAGDRPVDDWMAGQPADALLAMLKAGGIPATRLTLDNRDAFLSDPANRALSLSISAQHPVYGAFETIGGAWNFGPDLRLSLDLPPPLLGQHTRMILSELGLAEHAQQLLFDEQIIRETRA